MNEMARRAGALAVRDLLVVGDVYHVRASEYIDTLRYDHSVAYDGGDPVEEMAGVDAVLTHMRRRGLLNSGNASSVRAEIQARIDAVLIPSVADEEP